MLNSKPSRVWVIIVLVAFCLIVAVAPASVIQVLIQLAGDVTGPQNATVVGKINGTTVPTNSAANQVLVTTASAVSAWSTLPSCVDTGGNHLNYNNSTQVFTCGTSGGGSGTVTSVAQTFTGGLISVSGSPITTTGTLALTVAGTSGGIPYFSSSSAWASSAALTSGQFVLGGGAGSAPTTSFSIVPSANGGTGVNNGTATLTMGGSHTDSGAFTSTFTFTGNTSVTFPTSGTLSTTTGTVTSVAQTFTGGLISVSGSPITSTGTLALTVAGTSGGIPYFSSSSTWASSAALTANAIVLGGGAGAAPTVLGSLGTTTTVLHGNAAGAPTFGAVSLTADVSGNLPVTNLNSGTSASSTTFWRGDGTWTVPFTLTTTGSSGAATFSAGTLNIPQYSGGSGLTINSTTISGGATNAILYGDGTLLQNNTGVTSTATGRLTHTINGLGTTTSDAVILTNTTAAAAGAQQVSPAIDLCGQGWKTNATAASQTVCISEYVLPAQSSVSPTGSWILASSINAGALTTIATITTSGTYLSAIAGTAGPWIASSGTPSSGFGGGVGGAPGVWVSSQTVTFGGGGATVGLASGGVYGWFAGALSGSPDTSLFRNSASGTVGIGKGSIVANGLLNAAGATFLDPTATTGSTLLKCQDGQGQSGACFQVAANGGAIGFSATGAGLISRYSNVATTGWGVPSIYGSGRQTAQTAAVASVATYTVGAADGTFIVSADVNVTTSTTHSFTVTVAYTDETNTARTLTLNFSQLAGTIAPTITNVTGAGPYEGIPLQIRCKAATAITIATTGTFTTVTYNVEGYITQIG